MVSLSPIPRMKIDRESVATAGGGIAALLAGGTIRLAPGSAIDDLIVASGVAALLPASGPPFGDIPHGLVALGGAAAAGGVVWSLLYLVFGRGGLVDSRRRRAAGQPVVRRADAHPDCPPKHPMSAADLGTPLMDVPPPAIERDLPRDLEQPLAAFHPEAIRAAPLEPTRPVAPLAILPVKPVDPPVDPSVAPPVERLETFSLPPVETPARSVMPEPATDSRPSIETLLRRLEEGAIRRAQHV